MKNNDRIFVAVICALLLASFAAVCVKKRLPSEVRMSKEILMDKIRGGWAGQTIGCTYGGPTEFKFTGMISDEYRIPWDDHQIKWWFDHFPGLYDDIYMDLTFVEVFQKEGLDAPVESFANAFAKAPYPLWHANRQGRYNILNGIMPPASGHWLNNPHADDIDFQIEADYAGLMAPGMVNAATDFTDAIGHMMTYGDGWYGGVYIAAMYALAFVSDDVGFVVAEALKAIPEQSKYYRAMADIIRWHKRYPGNWEITWGLFNRKYGYDIGCPDGVDAPFNIDAVLNSGYVIIGLLYGEKDFFKTIDISTRCGQDSDCNPASSGGILGTMLGFSGIPEKWKKPVYEIEDRDFAYTDISLNQAVQYSFEQSLQVIERNGGSVEADHVSIKVQKPRPVRYEKSFEGHWPVSVVQVRKDIRDVDKIEFVGKGIVVKYYYNKGINYQEHGYVGEVEVYLDGQLSTVLHNPTGDGSSAELFYKYDLPSEKHTVTFCHLNQEDGLDIIIDSYIVYDEKPADIP